MLNPLETLRVGKDAIHRTLGGIVNVAKVVVSQPHSVAASYVPRKVHAEVFGHLYDVLLGAELVLLVEDVVGVHVVLVQQRLHPRPLGRRQADAQGRKHVANDLKTPQS